MKHLLHKIKHLGAPLALITLLLLPGLGWGQTVIYSTGFESSEGFTAGTTYDNTTIKYDGPTGQQWGTYYGTASTTSPIAGAQSMQMRWYTTAPSNLGYTFTNFDLANVTSVSFKAKNTTGINVIVSYSIDGGISYTGSQTYTLSTTYATFNYTISETGEFPSVRIKFQLTYTTAPSSTSRLYIDDVVVSGMTGGNPTAATPTFTPGTGTYYSAQDVEIATETENSTIYYTTDGSDPDDNDTEYTEAITVNSTTTIKAIAYATDYDPSAIASATYTFPTEIADIATLRAQATGSTWYKLTGEAVLTYQTANRNAKYIQDATGAILIDDNAGIITTTYNLYDGITGITGTLAAFQNMLQFTPVADPGAATSSGNTVTPEVVTLANLTTAHQAKLVKVLNTTISETGNFAASTNYTLTDGSKGTGVLRTAYSDLNYIGTPIPEIPQDLTGVVLQYNAAIQLVPRSTADFVEYVSTDPTITVAPTTLTGFTYVQGSGPSAEQTFTVTGTNLTNNLVVTGSTNYEISASPSGTFGEPITFVPEAGAVSATIYVRLKAGLAVGSYNDEPILVTSTGADPKTVTCSGSVTAPPPPAAPVATAATNVANTSFTANWNAVDGATGYMLDVYTLVTGSATLTEGFNNGTTASNGWTFTGISGTYSTSGNFGISSPSVRFDDTNDQIITPAFSGSSTSLSFWIKGQGTNASSALLVEGYNGTSWVSIHNITNSIPTTGTTYTYNSATTPALPEGILQFRFSYTKAAGNLAFDDVSINYNSNDQSLVSGYNDLNVGDVITYPVSDLTSNTTYYYVIRAENDYGTSANSNEISVTTPLPVYTLLGAEDAAANYSTWANSSNEGCGFGAWTLTSGGSGGSYLGGTGLGASTFGIYSGGDGSGNFFTARRDFIDNMPVGSTFQVSMGYTGVSTGGSIGISLFSNNNFRLTFKFVGGNSFWVVNDGGSDFATTIPWDDNAPLSFAFTRGSGNVYSLTITQSAITYDAGNYTASSGTMDIDRIEIFTSGQGGGQNLGFDALVITSNPSVIPAASSVFVKGCVELAEDFEVEDLTIEAGNTLQVDAGFDLTVNGTFDNQSDASALVLKSDASATASLIHGTADVPATVERYITAATWETAGSGWHLLSSPVAAQGISGTWTPIGEGNDYDFYAFDETATTEYWLNQKVGANNITTFIPGKGYLVAYQQTGTKTFSGTLNAADVTLSGLTNTSGSAYPGWHLVGNPFASAVDYDLGTWAKTNIDQEIQVWNSTEGSYKTSTEVGGIIPAMNGFMVHTAGSGSITVPADARVHNAANWYKSDEEFILLKANDLDGQTSQSSIVRFNPSATEAYDADFDAYFLSGFAPMFYSVSGSSLYALNTLPAVSNELAIPFGFVKNSATNYSIELAKNIPATIVYLTDIKTGTVTNLTDNSVYHFTAAEGDDANRFTLHFGTLGMDDPSTAAPVNIYAYSGVVYLNGLDATASVTITDLTGRVVMAERVNGNGLSMINAGNLPKGVYVVTAVSGSRVVSAKVIL